MKKNGIFLLTMAFVLVTHAQVTLQRTDLTKNISMKVPTEFQRLPTTTAKRSIREFIAEFSHTDGRTEMEVSRSRQRWDQSDPKLLKQFYKASIMQLYDRVSMKREEMVQENGRPVIYFEYVSTIINDADMLRGTTQRNDYNFLKYIILNDGVLICRFTTPAAREEFWRPAMIDAMTSLRTK